MQYFDSLNILQEAATDDTTAIKDKLVPLVDESLKQSKHLNGYKNLINDFIAKRSKDLYDIVPCSRIICGDLDMDKLFEVLDISKEKVSNILDLCYWADIDNFSPRAAKHEFTVAMICLIRYFLIVKNDPKMAELCSIHLAFSGKFYPSLHFKYYKTTTPQREVMEYVVNNELSQKFDLASQGSVIGAIKSICKTWLTAYKPRFKTLKDEDVKSIIDQLHSRINSFMKNISHVYYRVYADKDKYMVYSSDSYDQDNFHLADSDALRMDRYVENTINRINTTTVNYQFCKAASDENIKTNEIKSIIESIIGEPENRPTIKEYIQLCIGSYFLVQGSTKDVKDIAFLSYIISPKPNSKQKEILRMKEIVETWLCENSTAYLRRRSRAATKNSYERAVRMYFALIIHESNK